MHWEQLLSTQRLGQPKGPASSNDGRSPFQMDADRITFSSPFRRLGKKTQVHPLADNDHVHTRLTHSLEVASVGRSLGYSVGAQLQHAGKLPATTTPAQMGEIVQAACLAHDIGNPPFGHAGEEAIRAWFAEHPQVLEPLADSARQDFLLYEGNAAGFRIVTTREMNPYTGGMRLTFATLGTLLKYPWTADDPRGRAKRKYSVFTREVEVLGTVATACSMFEGTHILRHPLAYLMEAADDICYCMLDLEDGVEMGIIDLEDILDAAALPVLPYLQTHTAFSLDKLARIEGVREQLSFIRTQVIGHAICETVASFMTHHDALLDGSFASTTGSDIFAAATQTGELISAIKAFNHSRIFTDKRKTRLEIGAYGALGILLEHLTSAALESVEGRPSFKSERILTMLGHHGPRPDDNLHEAYLRVLDYITGMTDTYASKLARELAGFSE